MVKKEIKKSPRKLKKPTFTWVGALKDLGEQYTSVELQHKISEWRIESALRYQKDLDEENPINEKPVKPQLKKAEGDK